MWLVALYHQTENRRCGGSSLGRSARPVDGSGIMMDCLLPQLSNTHPLRPARRTFEGGRRRVRVLECMHGLTFLTGEFPGLGCHGFVLLVQCCGWFGVTPCHSFSPNDNAQRMRTVTSGVKDGLKLMGTDASNLERS